ncbi:MAG: histidine phosphatase family protein [Sulfuricurvum sp.]|nr:histidine phosphatase family protein [Sulfuricurvum sp.]
MELTLLRHAAPNITYQQRYIGHTDISIDNTLFEHNKIEHLLHQKFARIYSSDLKRCIQTLETIGIHSCTIDPRLREVRFKPSIEGKTFSEIEAMDSFNPDALDSKEEWHRFVCDESSLMFQSRIESFLNELPKEGNVLICAHGGTMRMLLSLIDSTLPDRHLEYLDTITISLG